jgi:hypothetical protein
MDANLSTQLKTKLNTLLNRFKALWKANSSTIQTFTFFIPAPPERKTGYREKEFDRAIYSFINKGYRLISINTQANPLGGMWAIFTVKSTSENTHTLDFDHELPTTDVPPVQQTRGPSIEGFYNLD